MTLLFLIAALGLTQFVPHAQDLSVRALTQKALDRRLAQMSLAPSKPPLVVMRQSPSAIRVCAIPLKEAQAPVGKHFDRMTLPVKFAGFDKMGQPQPVAVCKQP